VKLVALDYSTEQRSVAVAVDGVPLATRSVQDRRAGALELIDAALKAAGLSRREIDGLAVGLGPGSYTGIRSSIALVQGWELARSVRLFGVSSVEVMARGFGGEGRFFVVVDAQRGEFYCAGFESVDGRTRECWPLRIVSHETVLAMAEEGAIVIGPAAGKLEKAGPVVYPDAGVLARLATEVADPIDGAALEPVYLRPVEFRKAPPAREIE